MAQTKATTTLLLLFSFHAILTTSQETTTNVSKAAAKFPAIFFFGDSTVDTGNNVYMPTVFLSNHYPYGIDYAHHLASGRFSNGRLVPDLLSSMLGIKDHSPAFLDPTLLDDDLRTGVSFASAGTGYDQLTSDTSKTIPILKQVEMFKSYIDRLRRVVGNDEAARIVSNGVVVISAGTNDMVVNFYDVPRRRLTYSLSEYQEFLLGTVMDLVKSLYDLGCRKLAVAGLPPIGCIPLQITARIINFPHRYCIHQQNNDATIYNSKLQNKLVRMQQSLHGSRVVYVDLYEPLMDIIFNATKYGFMVTNRGCCGTGLFEIGPLCNIFTPICRDPSKYVFFDAIHPTEVVYRLLTNHLMKTVVPQLN